MLGVTSQHYDKMQPAVSVCYAFSVLLPFVHHVINVCCPVVGLFREQHDSLCQLSHGRVQSASWHALTAFFSHPLDCRH